MLAPAGPSARPPPSFLPARTLRARAGWRARPWSPQRSLRTGLRRCQLPADGGHLLSKLVIGAQSDATFKTGLLGDAPCLLADLSCATFLRAATPFVSPPPPFAAPSACFSGSCSLAANRPTHPHRRHHSRIARPARLVIVRCDAIHHHRALLAAAASATAPPLCAPSLLSGRQSRRPRAPA